MAQSLRDRIGVDIGRRAKLEDGLEWALRNEVYYVDVQLDSGENAMETFDDARCEAAEARAAGVQSALEAGGFALDALGEVPTFNRTS